MNETFECNNHQFDMCSVRKLKIRNFSGLSQNDDAHLQKATLVLETAICSILNCEKLEKSMEELYRIVEDLHSCNKRAALYSNLHALLENALIRKLESILSNNNEILTVVNDLWKQFCIQVKTLRNLFLCFDRSATNGCKYNTVQIMSTKLFKVVIISNTVIRKKIMEEVLYAIEIERRGGEKVNLPLIQSIINMFMELQVYEDVFQTEFIKLSEAFYAEEGNNLIKQLTVPEYLKYVNKRIHEEQDRARNYLSKETGILILDIINKYLIKNHLSQILIKGFHKLLDDNFIPELSLMHNLLTRINNGIKTLSDYFIDYLMKKGAEIVNTDNDKVMIQDLIAFKDKLDHIVETCFKSNDGFTEAIRNAFVKFINNRQNKPAQLLAKFVDSKLRCKEISDEHLEVIFDKVMVLFRFIQGKDVFEAFYKRDLAKRLLMGKSTSQDAEDSMIAKLRLECGPAFTSKIEGMFKDISVSRTINTAFKQYLYNLYLCEEGGSPHTDLCINVLTSSFWPNYPTYEARIPEELFNYQTIFQKFYFSNHSGRKLFWQPSLGHCVVKADFEAGKKELQVSLFQTLILLLFNNADKLSFQEIQEAINLEESELKRTLMSLACGKSRVLLKVPKGKDVEVEDLFMFNSKFSDKLFRVRINQILLKETPEEQKATEKSVMIDRQFQIDAAIVRIMKKKQSVNHNALLAELFNTLDIPVKPYDLKKRIELLIEREYMERDKDNPANYTYIA